MTKTIYVPQGYCASLTPLTTSYGIGGLYTDGFSACNILACIGEGKILLSHVDHLTIMISMTKLKTEIENIKNLQEIIIISRENETFVKSHLINLISSIGLGSKIIEKEIDIQHDGIYVSYNKENNNDIHPNVKKYPIRNREGLELIHHPQEQQIQAVQKIHQIIGINAKFITRKAQVRRFSVFDGLAWENMDVELSIDNSHQATIQEIKFIEKDDPFIMVAGKLAGIACNMKGKMPIVSSTKEIGMQVAFYMEGYINDFDYVRLFNRNLKEMIDSNDNIPETQEDLAFKQALNTIISKKEDSFSKVQDVYHSYENKAPNTEFKANIISEITTFARHYLERKYYHDLKQNCKEVEREATSFNEQAVKCYKENNFKNAAELFFSAIQLYTYCSLKNDPKLATLYYNCGRSLQQFGEYRAASLHLNTSLILRENYIEPRPRAEIEKTKKALAECISVQPSASTWVESSSISRTTSNSQGLGK